MIGSQDDRNGDFIRANGLDIYYERQGSGYPLILLHGGTLTCRMWDTLVSIYSQHFEVIAIDSRGHGRTRNPESENSYRMMSDDVACFVDQAAIDRPLILGYSDGGQIALELGMNHPEVAGGLVLSAAFYKLTSSYLEWARNFGVVGPGDVDTDRIESERPGYVEMLRRLHVTDLPEYWKELLHQLSYSWLTPPGYSESDLRRIAVPTLVMVGDRDPCVPVEQAVEMYRTINNAELAIGPGIDHGLPQRSELFSRLSLDFLLRCRELLEPTEVAA